MFKSAMYPAVIQFRLRVKQEPAEAGAEVPEKKAPNNRKLEKLLGAEKVEETGWLPWLGYLFYSNTSSKRSEVRRYSTKGAALGDGWMVLS
jgi:hypothetical protein